jgi:hypothetical protein
MLFLYFPDTTSALFCAKRTPEKERQKKNNRIKNERSAIQKYLRKHYRIKNAEKLWSYHKKHSYCSSGFAKILLKISRSQ